MDKTIEQADAGNGSAFRVPGFPYLRTNRFLASIDPSMDGFSSEKARKVWISRMREMDLEARKKEIVNLPGDLRSDLLAREGIHSDICMFFERMADYAEHLYIVDQQTPGFYEAVAGGAVIPDEYSEPMRIFGLYPLAAVPVIYFTGRVYDKFRKWHAMNESEIPVKGRLITYAPPEIDTPAWNYSARLFESKPAGPLGGIQLTETETRNLAISLAPCFIQDTAAPHDRLGKVEWDGETVRINTKHPTLYYYVTYAYIKDRPALQMNYVLWYPGRYGSDTPWFERGAIDGLTVRITLDAEGAPVVMDIMNTCGCYHFFVPRKDRIRTIRQKPFSLDPLVPSWLPNIQGDHRIGVHINSDRHMARHISSTRIPDTAVTYHLAPYDYLESLPDETGAHHSIFTPEGTVKGSERIEPYIFFSMGVPEVGSMRQRGRHPIVLVGKKHFDDPQLMNKTFIFY